MGNENGTWIMRGIPWRAKGCLHSAEDAIAFIEKTGFCPLFKNDIEGFSLEEHTAPDYWWSGDEKRDPWEWREQIARSGKVCYGKFFDKKAGFISKEWLPVFANYRRNGYDFDARYEDGLASMREKKIMDLFDSNELFSNVVKHLAGFGKDGEKGFEGTITSLQMQLYLCVRDFRQRTNKKGEPYGWPVAVYTTPEHLFGEKLIASGYKEDPAKSKEKVKKHIKELWG
ncbi:MAG: hypothetical protein J6113_05640 [Lachnospiraceae bacterium]|nr:hypothetical protein [Lachnospiraceae bacterium]